MGRACRLVYHLNDFDADSTVHLDFLHRSDFAIRYGPTRTQDASLFHGQDPLNDYLADKIEQTGQAVTATLGRAPIWHGEPSLRTRENPMVE